MHGDWSAPFGQSERFLFPGVLAIALAGFGLYAIDRRRVTIVAIGVIGFVISLGLNTPFYELLRALVFPYRGLRAPARASILVFMALAALGAYGWTRLMRGRSKSLTTVATVMMAAALLIEFRTTMDRWLTVPSVAGATSIGGWRCSRARWSPKCPLRAPMSFTAFTTASTCSTARGTGSRSSTVTAGSFQRASWSSRKRPSGFPDDRSIAYLKTRGVDFIVIHGSLMAPGKFGAMTAALLARPDIEAMAQFPQTDGVRHRGSACCDVVPSTARRVPRPNTNWPDGTFGP